MDMETRNQKRRKKEDEQEKQERLECLLTIQERKGNKEDKKTFASIQFSPLFMYVHIVRFVFLLQTYCYFLSPEFWMSL